MVKYVNNSIQIIETFVLNINFRIVYTFNRITTIISFQTITFISLEHCGFRPFQRKFVGKMSRTKFNLNTIDRAPALSQTITNKKYKRLAKARHSPTLF